MERKLSIGILAGGKSKRFGTNKVMVNYHGRSILEHLYEELKDSGDCRVSVDDMGRYRDLTIPHWRYVEDELKDIGPMEGFRQILKSMKEEYVFVTAADTPGMTADLVRYLEGYVSSDYIGFVMQEGEWIHPLCGIYHRSILDYVEKSIEAGQYGLMRMISGLPIKYVHLEDSRFSKDALCNLNFQEDYEELMRGRRVLCISGVKNSGKTTLLSKLLPELKAVYGKVGVIKHDGHDFEPDTQGTDTYRFADAGADKVAIFSDTKSAFFDFRSGQTVEELKARMQDCDLILLEGFKRSPFPKLEIVRQGNSETSVCEPEGLLAVVTDIPGFSSDLPVLPLNDVAAIASFIAKKI